MGRGWERKKETQKLKDEVNCRKQLGFHWVPVLKDLTFAFVTLSFILPVLMVKML